MASNSFYPRRTNILLVAILLMLALDCFAQKKSKKSVDSLSWLRQQDVYVFDPAPTKRYFYNEKYGYKLKVLSPETDRDKVYRVLYWGLDSNYEHFYPDTSLWHFPHLQELIIQETWFIPSDLSQYKELKVLDISLPEEGGYSWQVFEGYKGPNGYTSLPNFPECIYSLSNLRELYYQSYFIEGHTYTMISENIADLKNLECCYIADGGDRLRTPAVFLLKKGYNVSDFSNLNEIRWNLKREVYNDKSNLKFKEKHISENDTCYVLYSNGQPYIKGRFRDGKPDGQWLIYDSAGTLKQERFYKNGLNDSVWTYKWISEEREVYQKEYYKNGELQTIKNSYGICENYNDFPNRTVLAFYWNSLVESRFNSGFVQTQIKYTEDAEEVWQYFKGGEVRYLYEKNREFQENCMLTEIDTLLCGPYIRKKYFYRKDGTLRYVRTETWGDHVLTEEYFSPDYVKISYNEIPNSSHDYNVIYTDRQGNVIEEKQISEEQYRRK